MAEILKDEDNPLLKTLPPATDYLNYLIVVEHNLTKEQLPTLHGVLQDTKLTANIGWDLVHLLLPLLPESHQCLQDVARLGNPREVVLKVTELLGEIRNQEERGDDQDEPGNGTIPGDVDDPTSHAEQASQGGDDATAPSKTKPVPQNLRYTCLVEMLAILHPRIKTQYPSRFLSTSLQAVLPAYATIAQDPSVTEATLDMVKNLYPSVRPRLPPRKSSSRIPSTSAAPVSAPDPEAQDTPLGTDEVALQARLLQSFLTFIAEGYVSGLRQYEDIPGLAWSARYYEKTHPEKKIPGRPSYLAMFVEEEEELHTRDTILGQCLAISRDLKIHSKDLLSTITHGDPQDEEDEEELPSKASDVPLSRSGSLYLFCAMAASSYLFDAPNALPPMQFFPDFANLLSHCLSASASSDLGREPEAMIDAVIFLGNVMLKQISVVDASADQLFNDTLQQLSLLSANTPSAVLRYQAHLLTSRILHQHPLPDTRLAFIKDTLQHCPYENLKASAVSWLKDELLAASDAQDDQSIFATPAVLLTLSTVLLVDPLTIIHRRQDPGSPNPSSNQEETFAHFMQYHSFIIAVLNLLFLILSSPTLPNTLKIKELGKDFDINGYCDRMRAASLLFQGWIETEGEMKEGNGADEYQNGSLAELQILDQAVERVMEAAGAAGFP